MDEKCLRHEKHNTLLSKQSNYNFAKILLEHCITHGVNHLNISLSINQFNDRTYFSVNRSMTTMEFSLNGESEKSLNHKFGSLADPKGSARFCSSLAII